MIDQAGSLCDLVYLGYLRVMFKSYKKGRFTSKPTESGWKENSWTIVDHYLLHLLCFKNKIMKELGKCIEMSRLVSHWDIFRIVNGIRWKMYCMWCAHLEWWKHFSLKCFSLLEINGKNILFFPKQSVRIWHFWKEFVLGGNVGMIIRNYFSIYVKFRLSKISKCIHSQK